MAPRTPLVDPAEYFARTSRATAQNRGIGVFVLYVVLEIAWLSVAVRLLFAQVHDLDPRLEQQVMSAITGIIAITAIIIVIAWLVVAAIMHYGTSGSNGPGTFTDALSVAGWAYAPELVFLVPSALYGWWAVRQRSFDGSDPSGWPPSSIASRRRPARDSSRYYWCSRRRSGASTFSPTESPRRTTSRSIGP